MYMILDFAGREHHGSVHEDQITIMRRGLHSYSPPMELTNDGRFWSVSIRCIVGDPYMVKGLAKGANFDQWVGRSSRSLVVSVLFYIQDHTTLSIGQTVFARPNGLARYGTLSASYVYEDWTADGFKSDGKHFRMRKRPSNFKSKLC